MLLSIGWMRPDSLSRMQMRRFARLTNGFSKKAENHAHAVALHMVHYSDVRIGLSPPYKLSKSGNASSTVDCNRSSPGV